MIESKYTIEYVNPDPERNQGTSSRKPILSFIFSGILLTALLFFLLNLIPENNESNSLNSTVTSSVPAFNEPVKGTPKEESKVTAEEKDLTPLEKQTNQIISDSIAKNEKATEVKAQKAEETLAAQKDINQEIEKNLALLKQQLLDSQKKNNELATELDAQIMENIELSTLLEDSLYKINKNDKSYIKELEKLESNTLSKEEVTKKEENNDSETKTKKVTVNEKKSENQPDKKENISTAQKNLPKESVEKQVTKTNQVDLSTSSQVDAIVSVMKQNSTTKSKLSSDPSSKVNLQNEINELITDDNKSNDLSFQDSLNKI